jgi:hypothetical protein
MMGVGGEAIGKSMADSELSGVRLRRKTSDRGMHMRLRHMHSTALSDLRRAEDSSTLRKHIISTFLEI